ncbi:MAG TPA: hypothetical protein VKX49_01640 [Bryobacteraceae bacterium]|nr:hypothetical protein [Bryobacteraceae bacterium]
MFRFGQVSVFGLAISGVAFAQAYPHAFPRQGATKLFENERVIVWDATWPIGVEQPIHQHKYDMALVFLRYGKIKVTTPAGKVSIAEPFEVPRPMYQARGVTHKEEAIGNAGDSERHAIMVDLKDFTPPPMAAKPGMEPAFPREGAKDVIDNARVRFWDFTWPANKALAQHVHQTDSVEIFVSDGTLRTRLADGHEQAQPVHYGYARFVPRGQVDTEEAVNGTPRAFTIEIK